MAGHLPFARLDEPAPWSALSPGSAQQQYATTTPSAHRPSAPSAQGRPRICQQQQQQQQQQLPTYGYLQQQQLAAPLGNHREQPYGAIARNNWDKDVHRQDSASLERAHNFRALAPQQEPLSQATAPPGLVPTAVFPLSVRPLFPYANLNAVQSECFQEAFHSDINMCVSSPTGSGKTGVLEMALARLWSARTHYGAEKPVALYLAPLKALTHERLHDWKSKLAGTSLRICELTGDSDWAAEEQTRGAGLILTTPEKWDSFTRFRRDAQSVISRVALLLVDEIHILGEEGRGPTLEAVIARMKILSRSPVVAQLPVAHMRIIGASATISNIADICTWIGGGCSLKHFDQRYRPVPLRWHVEAYDMFKPFTFDKFLFTRLYGIVQRYCSRRPSLVFCNSRSNAAAAASAVATQSSGHDGGSDELRAAARSCSDRGLARLLERGVAFHHSGLTLSDRRVVEEAFLSGALPVLCSTSGLAQGVNLPAHLVVICNSSQYASGGYREYTNIEMLQMAGRAGRPQFDDEGVCVVMTSHDQKRRHEQILSGECTVESHMLEHMQEHLNAEIGSQHTMTSLQACVEWFRATFLHVRVQRNPVAYRVPKGLTPAEMSARLDRIPADALRALSDASMIDLDADGARIRPRHLGTLMARSCVNLPTMCLFRELGASSGAASILKLLSQADEFKEACVLRVAEKKTLAALNADASAIRFPIDGSRKAKCKTTASKVWLLLQVRCSGAPLGEFHGLQPLLLRACRRIVGAIVEYAEGAELGVLLCAAVAVGKSLESGAGWYDESLAPFRQLAGVGAVLAAKMRDASDGSLETFAQLTTARAESLCGKSVSTALAQVRSLVDGALVVDATAGQHGSSPLTVAVRVYAKTHAAGGDARWVLCVVDGASRLLVVRRFRVSELARKGELVYELKVPPASARHHLRANLLSVDCFGFDTAVTIELPGAEQPPELVDPAAVLADGGSKAARAKAADAKTTKTAKAAASKQAKTSKTKQAKPATAKSWRDAIKAAATKGGTSAARQTPQEILASLEYGEDDETHAETLAQHIFGEDAAVDPTEDSVDGLALESLDDAFDVALGVDLTGSPPSAPYEFFGAPLDTPHHAGSIPQ